MRTARLQPTVPREAGLCMGRGPLHGPLSMRVHCADVFHNHGDENCVITPLISGPLMVEAFQTEAGYDELTFAGVRRYSGLDGSQSPMNLRSCVEVVDT
eukprot:gene56992-biopygen72768